MMEHSEPRQRLESRRVLVVEDNFLVALALLRTLEEHGCRVIGPAASVREGEQLAAEQELDGAILDVNIRGGTSAPIAERLEERGVPFVFITGYGSPQMLPARLQRVQRLMKPLNTVRLLEVVARRFGGAA